MDVRGNFGIVVRSVGLLAAVFGLYDLADTFWTSFGLFFFGSSVHWDVASMIQSLATPCTLVIGGLLLLRHARRVVRFTYPFDRAACENCGYDLRATPGRCPECGTEA